jgi:hypothetical protein
MADVAENLRIIKSGIPESVTLIAVSKTKPVADIRRVYDAGQRDFGENRVQEVLDKAPQLPGDIRWHLIGHLQSNKVKYIAPFVHLIHSVDSLKLLEEINRQGQKLDRKIPCLLQFHIASEDTKFGMNPEEAHDLLNSDAYTAMRHVLISGVMGMATFTDDKAVIVREFNRLAEIFRQLKTAHFGETVEFKEISMGMSGDYPIAINCGSTMIRVGSAIFGER